MCPSAMVEHFLNPEDKGTLGFVKPDK